MSSNMNSAIATRVLHTAKIRNQCFSVILSMLQGVLRFDNMDESLPLDIFLRITGNDAV